jgi:hypothetical protein
MNSNHYGSANTKEMQSVSALLKLTPFLLTTFAPAHSNSSYKVQDAIRRRLCTTEIAIFLYLTPCVRTAGNKHKSMRAVCGFIYLDRLYPSASLNVQFITDSFACLKSVQILCPMQSSYNDTKLLQTKCQRQSLCSVLGCHFWRVGLHYCAQTELFVSKGKCVTKHTELLSSGLGNGARITH